jgi:phospholipid/cholesterol/gamma-HCH transport system substrate-binding protein
MRKLALLLVATLAAGVLAGCGADTITVTAKFDDVGDLANGAPVTMADIRIGRVSHMTLAGNEALVTLELERDAQVPQGSSARVRRTSVLGERIIDIVMPEGVHANSPLLADGGHIDETTVRSDLEDLVAEGSEVFGAISASQLAVMIEEGARGFGDQGEELGNLLQNYRQIIGRYAGRSDQIIELIGSLKGFNETLASRSEAHGRSVQNAARSIRVLRDESDRLERAIVSLSRLARGGRGILEAHVTEMERFFQQTRVILGVLEDEQGSIRKFLRWAPGHNYNTQGVEYVEFNQVIQDFVFCGMNDDPKNPARRCKGGE